METTEPPRQCWCCDEPLGEAHGLAPPRERDGKIWCDDCYHAEYAFVCAWCGAYGDRADQHAYLIVWDAEAAGLALPGVYLVREHPYYTTPLIGRSWLHPQALKWLGALPPTLEDVAEAASYPCGHCCAACHRALRHDIAVRQGVMHDIC